MFCIRIFFLAAGVFAAVCSGADWGGEAELFLKKMRPGLQDLQADAVKEARLGRPGALEAVRNSRNGSDPLPSGVRAENLPGGHRLYRPAARGKAGGRSMLVYFHGGGWAFGSVNSCARFCSAVCASASVPVLGVHYRLAPEHPYPAPLEDCLQAVRLAAEKAAAWGADPGKIFLGGDSAGGNLALACALKLGKELRLRGLVLFYPVVKAWADGSESWRKYGRGFGLDSRLMEEFNLAYCGDCSPRNPLISPACASGNQLSALPPVLQINAEHDILRDQGTEFLTGLKRLGVRTDHEIFPGTVHLFITVRGQEGAFRAAVAKTGAFIAVVGK